MNLPFRKTTPTPSSTPVDVVSEDEWEIAMRQAQQESAPVNQGVTRTIPVPAKTVPPTQPPQPAQSAKAGKPEPSGSNQAEQSVKPAPAKKRPEPTEVDDWMDLHVKLTPHQLAVMLGTLGSMGVHVVQGMVGLPLGFGGLIITGIGSLALSLVANGSRVPTRKVTLYQVALAILVSYVFVYSGAIVLEQFRSQPEVQQQAIQQP